MCEKRMLVLITGETGSGKSACLRLLGSRLDPNTYLFNYVANSSLPRNFIVKALMIIDIKSPLKQTTSHSLTQICNIPSTITILQRYRFPCCVKINIAQYCPVMFTFLPWLVTFPSTFPGMRSSPWPLSTLPATVYLLTPPVPRLRLLVTEIPGNDSRCG